MASLARMDRHDSKGSRPSENADTPVHLMTPLYGVVSLMGQMLAVHGVHSRMGGRFRSIVLPMLSTRCPQLINRVIKGGTAVRLRPARDYRSLTFPIIYSVQLSTIVVIR